MAFELQMLLASVAILMILLIVQGGLVPATHGFKWGLGPRDEPRAPSVLQGRMNRIVANHMESMALFTPLALIACLLEISTPETRLGAALYIGARAAFAVIYFAGVPVLRSVAWGVSVLGLFTIAFELV